MKLVLFGDSFTAGDNVEYRNEFYGGKDPVSELEYHQFSYGSRLYENMIDIFDSYEIIATGGWSNLCIWNEIYKYFEDKNTSDYFVFIGWSTPNRIGYKYDPEFHCYGGMNKEESRIQHVQYKMSLLTQEENCLHYETQLLAAHSYLDLKKIKHGMIQAFADHRYMTKQFIIHEEDLPFWINWNSTNNTLFDIARNCYCDPLAPKLDGHNHNMGNYRDYAHLDTISGCFHPSPKGHKLIANTLEPYIRQLIK